MTLEVHHGRHEAHPVRRRVRRWWNSPVVTLIGALLGVVACVGAFAGVGLALAAVFV